MPSFAIHTLGCKVNQYETEEVISGLMQHGFELVGFSDQADVYIINTCTVTSTSDHKSRQWIAKAVRGKQGALVVVTGCYAERAKPEIEQISGVDVVLGSCEKEKLADLILRRFDKAPAVASLSNRRQHFHTRALVKVEDGCDNFCSFCIVPYVRGEPTSRSIGEVVSEVIALTQSGVKEVVLTGVNLGKYGQDLKQQLQLIDLLERLQEISGLARIRLSSIEVTDLAPDVVTLLSSSSKFCRHLHVPLQSGDDHVLKRMNRHYTPDEYLQVIMETKEKIPGVAITTDVMVGFPGETQEQFEKTKLVLEQVRFKKAHVFKYSDREGTKAYDFPDKLAAEVKERRSKALLEVSKDLDESFVEAFLGETVEVLVEKSCENGHLTGLTDNYVRVYFEGKEDNKGSILKVLAEKRDGQNLLGRIV